MMNSNSIKEPNYPKIKAALENNQEFIFFGKITFFLHIIFVSLIIIISTMYDLEFIIGSIIYVGVLFSAIILYYFIVYRVNIIINSKKYQYRIKDKTERYLEWKDIMSISKAYYRTIFNREKPIMNNEKWKCIIIKPKLGKGLKLYPKMIKHKDYSQKYMKYIIFYILSYYHNRESNP